MASKRTVTLDDIDAMIAKVDVYTLGVKTTAVVLTLKNGFEVVGTSSCVDPANYKEDIGAVYAKQRALDKVWELEGYALQTLIGPELAAECRAMDNCECPCETQTSTQKELPQTESEA